MTGFESDPGDEQPAENTTAALRWLLTRKSLLARAAPIDQRFHHRHVGDELWRRRHQIIALIDEFEARRS